MDIRERHFGPISDLAPNGEELDVDLGILIRRLLLFEFCYLESSQLREIPEMVKVFGYEGVMQLLDNPNFAIICDAMTAGSVGRLAGLNATVERGPLPLGSYHIAHIHLSTKNGLHDALQNVHRSTGLTKAQIQKLKLALVDKVMTYPVEAGNAGIADYMTDLENSSSFVSHIINAVAIKDLGVDVRDKLEIDINKLAHDGDYSVHTNLSSSYGVEDVVADKTIERALLGLAGLNQRLQLMKSFNAVTGFRDAESPFYEEKLSFVYKQLNPNDQEARFQRVERIGSLPGIVPGQKVDIYKLLELRNDPECIAVRRWLRTTDGVTDESIKSQFNSVRDKLASITHSTAGKAIRFIATNGIGLLPPPFGTLLGPTSSLADKFIADKLIGLPGPVCFLSNQYSSIFKD